MAENKKRTYEKMKIEKVSLIPDEAILDLGCKTDGGDGPTGLDCGGFPYCNLDGS